MDTDAEKVGEGSGRAGWTLREARRAYFRENDFGEDGGYGSPWVEVKVGPLPMWFPNTGSRVRAISFHDLHHLVTGYETNLVGEFEIAAWEIGAGCKDFGAAWVINLAGLAGGALIAPRRVFRAFVRGLRSESLYGADLEALLDRTVGDVRREHVKEASDVGAGDVARFALAVGLGATVGGSLFTLLVATGPFLALWSLVAPRFVRRVIAAG